MVIMAKENEKKTQKLEAKREAALAKKAEINEKLEELRLKILDEKDEKVKAQLRKERDELNAVRSGIVITDDKVSVPMAKSKKKKLQAIIAIVVVIALLFAYVATGLAKHGFVSTLGHPQRAFTGLVLTDYQGKKHNIKTSTYNYYYANYYNTLEQQQSLYAQYLSGQSDVENIDFDKPLSKQTTTDDDGNEITWAKKVEDTVLDNIKHVYSLYYAAVEANNGEEPEITEDQQKEIDETLDQFKEYANNAKYTLDAYISLAVAYGVNSEVIQHEGKVQAIAENFESDYQFSDEEYDAYRSEHEDDIKGVDIMYFEADNEDDAKEFVSKLKDDGSNFTKLASKYTSDEWNKKAFQDPNEVTYYNMTRANLQSLGGAIGVADEHSEEAEETEETEDEEAEEEHEHTYSGLDWLFSADRKSGDKYNYSTTVVYVINPAYVYEGNTVNVRHILIQPEKPAEAEETEETEETEDAEDAEAEEEAEPEKINASEATAEQLNAAKAKADEVLAEFNSGDKTVDSFAELAKQYSSDGNASTGGQYEAVYTNQMVPTFNNWIFDSSRKEGDVDIVLTEYGYHIIYFEGKNELLNWQAAAKTALSAEDSDSSLNKIENDSKIKKSFLGSRYFVNDLDMN